MLGWQESCQDTLVTSLAVDSWTTNRLWRAVETWPVLCGMLKQANKWLCMLATQEMLCLLAWALTTEPLSLVPVTLQQSFGMCATASASKPSPATSLTSTPSRSSRTGTRSPQGRTTPPAGFSTSEQTRSWACTHMTTSSVESRVLLSASQEGCCWQDMMTSTAMCGTACGPREQVYWQAMITGCPV